MQNPWEGWLELLRSHISFLAEEPNKCESFDLEDNSHFLHKLEHTGMRRLQFTDSGSLDHIIIQQTIPPSPSLGWVREDPGTMPHSLSKSHQHRLEHKKVICIHMYLKNNLFFRQDVCNWTIFFKFCLFY